MRLVNAALYKRGGRIESTTGGRLDCAEIVIQTMSTQAPKVIIPCNGDRVFGMAQDTEMVFDLPLELVISSRAWRAPIRAACVIPSPWPCAQQSRCPSATRSCYVCSRNEPDVG